jgi:O-antigen/teichoic acid export membrane protein
LISLDWLRNGIFASRLNRNIGYTLGRQLFAAGAQLLLVVLIARSLGPEGNGRYAMAILLPSIMANVLNLGIGPATVYYVGRRALMPQQAVKGNILLGMIIGAIGLGLGLSLIFTLHDVLFPGVPKTLLLLGLLAFPVALVLALLNSVHQGIENFRAFNWSTLAPPYVTLAVTGAFLYGLNSGVEGVIIAYFTGQIAGLLISTLFVRGNWINIGESDEMAEQHRLASVSYYRKILGYGWKAHLSNILAFVNYRADIFLVNLFISPAATGVYVIAVQISERLWMLSQSVSSVLLPRLSAMYRNPEARLTLTQRSFWVTVILTGLVAILAAFGLYWLLVPVFGKEYIGTMEAFLWLLPGIVAGAGSRVQANCIAAAGKPEWNSYASLIVATANIIMNIILIPLLGVVGAAMATSSAYILNACIKGFLVKRTLSYG